MSEFPIVSIQSILYGKNGNIFDHEGYSYIMECMKKVILWAEAHNVANLVFGCPRNRSTSENSNLDDAVRFFKEIGDFAYLHNTIVAMEANPVIYNTNYINHTDEAFELCNKVNSKGFKVNVDLGTIIYNNEDIQVLVNNSTLINHVHLSEPYLAPLSIKAKYYDLFRALIEIGYDKYVSIEMKENEDFNNIIKTVSTMCEAL